MILLMMCGIQGQAVWVAWHILILVGVFILICLLMFCLLLVAMGGGVQKRVSDPLELLLGMVMMDHV